jgi:hypothetical protein
MERNHLEDLGLEGKIILKPISKSEMGRHGLHLSGSGRDRRRVVLNAVMNLSVLQNAGKFLTS